MSIPLISQTTARALLCLAVLLCGAPLAHSEEKLPARFRGHIESIDTENRVLVVNAGRHGTLRAPWDDQSSVRSPNTRSFDGLQPGMFVIIYMQENKTHIFRVRHTGENDREDDSDISTESSSADPS